MDVIGGVDMFKDSGEEARRKVLTQSMEDRQASVLRAKAALYDS